LFLAGIGSICVCITNSIYNWSACKNYGHGKNIRLFQIVKTELGLLDEDSKIHNRSKGIDTIDVVGYSKSYNYSDSANVITTLNITITETNCSLPVQTIEHISECTFLPIVPILGACAVCLEITRIILASVKAIQKRKRKNKVGQKQMKQTMSKKNCMKMTSKSTSQKKFHRTKSVPEIPNSTVKNLRRHNSTIELGAVQPMPLPTPVKSLKVHHKYQNPKEQTESLEVILKNTIKSMCMRSATIAIIFAIVGTVAVSFNEFLVTDVGFSSFGSSMNIAAIRLVYYCLTVCMFMCDQDVSTYTWKKFKCQDQVHPFIATA